MPQIRLDPERLSVDGCLYIHSGSTPEGSGLGGTEVFDPAENMWRELPAMFEERKILSMLISKFGARSL